MNNQTTNDVTVPHVFGDQNICSSGYIEDTIGYRHRSLPNDKGVNAIFVTAECQKMADNVFGQYFFCRICNYYVLFFGTLCHFKRYTKFETEILKGFPQFKG